MDAYRDELSCYTNVKNLSEVSETGYGKFALVAGLVIDVANFGNRVAITLDDGSCRLELSCYMDKYQRILPLIESNVSLNATLTQKYAHLTKEDKNFNPKRLNMQTLAKIDKKDWEQLNNLNGVILIARISVNESDGRVFARLQGGKISSNHA